MTNEDEIISLISNLHTPGFFITVQFPVVGESIPTDLEDFIFSKLALIEQGIQGRKFIYQKNDWRMIFTFFPTDRVVDEKYALKNKVFHY